MAITVYCCWSGSRRRLLIENEVVAIGSGRVAFVMADAMLDNFFNYEIMVEEKMEDEEEDR